MRRHLALVLAAALLLAACKSTSSTASGGATATTVAVTDTRAPGVTPDAIKVGVVYYDVSSLYSVLHINNGDWVKAYNAIFDDINAHGGIHGRKLVPDIIGINPASQTAADAACVKITQDDKSFVAVGFFLNDNVLCYVNTNATATIGGAQTPSRLAQARAPWYTVDAGDNLEINVVKSLAKAGKLNGKVAVMATAADESLVNDKIRPALTAAGVQLVETAFLDAPASDTTATQAQAEVISEKFKAAGATQVLVVGLAGPGSFLSGLAKTDYRPQIVLTNQNGTTAYINSKGNDFTVLKGALTAGPFGPADAQLALGGPTKACLDIQRNAGLVIKPPTQVPQGEPNQWVASSNACQYMGLLTAILQKAGPTLNYGTFAAAGNSLGKIVLPGYPDPWTFGAPPNADGNPKIYVFTWNPSTMQFEIAKS